MKEKKSCISCECNCQKNGFIYPYLLPVIFIVIRFCHDRLLEIPGNKFKRLKYHFPNLFYLYLPKILSIILIPIIICRTKGDSKEQQLVQKKYHLIIKEKNKKRIFLFFYIISTLEVVQEIGDYILYYYQRIGILGWLIEKKSLFIIFVPIIFCYFILKIDLHKHHIFALILGFIGVFIINIIRFVLGFAHLKDYLFYLINTIYSAVLSLAWVLIKYVMIKYLIRSPYIFLFYDGLFCLLNSIIFVLLEYFIVINLPDYVLEEDGNYFANNFLGIFKIFKELTNLKKTEYYIYFYTSFILTFIYYILLAFTIYNYSPFLLIIVETCLPIDSDIIEYIFGMDIIIKDPKKTNNLIKRVIIQGIGYIIIFIAALILNEIIILNFCGFNKNIFSNISFRGTIDASNIIELKDNNFADELNSIDDEGD